MSDSERITQIEKYFKLSTRALAIAINLKNPQTLYDIHNGKHGISKDLAERIAVKYLNVNKSWLLTGEGEMLKEQPMVNSFSFAGDGNNNVGNSIQGSGSIHSKTISSSQNESVLLQKIGYLESLLAEKDKQLAEKERLIEILMKNK